MASPSPTETKDENTEASRDSFFGAPLRVPFKGSFKGSFKDSPLRDCLRGRSWVSLRVPLGTRALLRDRLRVPSGVLSRAPVGVAGFRVCVCSV